MTIQGRKGNGTSYAGQAEKKITINDIELAKKNINLEKSAVLLSCSYLGKMTKDEFEE